MIFRATKNCGSAAFIFSHPDYNCRYWNLTNSCAVALADCTADREFHPALKMFLFNC